MGISVPAAARRQFRPPPLRSAAALSILALAAPQAPRAAAVERCEGSALPGIGPDDPDEGGVCPDDNACCPLGPGRWGCVPYNPHLGTGPGVCCPLEGDDRVATGCAAGYRCSEDVRGGGRGRRRRCERTVPPVDDRDAAERPPVLPRYALCELPAEAIGTMQGFPVSDGSGGVGRDADGGAGGAAPELAYFSTGGSITDASIDRSSVRMVLIVVHGSGRNADDYLCSAQAAVSLQRWYSPESVLVIAPRFLVPEDGPTPEFRPARGGATPLRWNETYPIAHTWRYGADSIPSGGEGGGGAGATVVSSFEAMDRLVEHFASDAGDRYPRLERVVVAGHSAGGQFAQRWALTSYSPAWSFNPHNNRGGKSDAGGGDPARSSMRKMGRPAGGGRGTTPPRPTLGAVAANPRSFAYLDPRRIVDGALRLPDRASVDACPGYDRWEWGLEPGGPVWAPYKDRAVDGAGGADALSRRYAARDVAYLAGALDVLPLRGSCEDDGFQGPNRFERSGRFFGAMEIKFGGENGHRRLPVVDVPHDHALMFQSHAGLEALFGPTDHGLIDPVGTEEGIVTHDFM